ncbi:Uncharacterised protein [Yersinia aldovae]|nr:Uncharacterised protein [Yersinia aldovae]
MPQTGNLLAVGINRFCPFSDNRRRSGMVTTNNGISHSRDGFALKKHVRRTAKNRTFIITVLPHHRSGRGNTGSYKTTCGSSGGNHHQRGTTGCDHQCPDSDSGNSPQQYAAQCPPRTEIFFLVRNKIAHTSRSIAICCDLFPAQRLSNGVTCFFTDIAPSLGPDITCGQPHCKGCPRASSNGISAHACGNRIVYPFTFHKVEGLFIKRLSTAFIGVGWRCTTLLIHHFLTNSRPATRSTGTCPYSLPNTHHPLLLLCFGCTCRGGIP